MEVVVDHKYSIDKKDYDTPQFNKDGSLLNYKYKV